MKKITAFATLLTLVTACNKETAPAPAGPAQSNTAAPTATALKTVELRKTGTVIEPVVIRSKPGTDGARVKCAIAGVTCGGADPYCMAGKTSAAPAKVELVFSGRTAEKVKVGKWENYWYKLASDIDATTLCEGEAWVFGQFIELK